MDNFCTIQLYAHGQWHDVALVSLLAPVEHGWQAPSLTGYTMDWALLHTDANDAWAMSADYPVSVIPRQLTRWPTFLIDMLPQGYGRGELLRQLGLPETATASVDWQLLLCGAGNPIGHLRVKEAADRLSTMPTTSHGFTDEEVARRDESFVDYLGEFGLFVAGSSGVQGEWPKILLTRAQDGLLYLDHAVPDGEGTAYYIVKFGRGANPQLATILRNEAPYMQIAQHLGLRVHAPLTLHERALFIPRFDRINQDGQVVRLAQESLASFIGLAGFEQTPTHEEVCAAIIAKCTDPLIEIMEYLRRDVANLALGNKDNHARNTAFQRDFTGHIQLTPLFDFAPMYLHPDGIARRIRWANGEARSDVDWAVVIDHICQSHDLPRDALVRGMQAMLPALQSILEDGAQFGLEPEIHQFIQPNIASQIQRLAMLH